jgi:hypothetical protein
MNNAKIFAIWFSLGTGLLLSGAFCAHSISVFLTNNLFWWDHLLDMMFLFIVAGGVFTGLLALSVLRITTPQALDSQPLELDKFISQSLTQTLKGISDANDSSTGGKPIDKAPKPFLLMHGNSTENGAGIEFDIAVTTKSQSGVSGVGKLEVYVVNAEVGKQRSLASEQVSRMKFRVFVNQIRG